MLSRKSLSIALATILVGAVAVVGASGKGAQGSAPAAPAKLKTAAPWTGSTPSSPTAVLWDQTNLASTNASPDQDFEAAYDAYDSNAADDFVVPASGWTISRVNTLGVYSVGGGPAASVDVIFSANAAGLPGAPMAGCTYLGVLPTDTAGSFNINLVPPCSLPVAGTYWLEVQTNMDYGAGLQHYWTTRTASNGLGGKWRNPGNGFATGCTAWGNIQTCLPTAGGPDWAFSLEGVILPVELMSFGVE